MSLVVSAIVSSCAPLGSSPPSVCGPGRCGGGAAARVVFCSRECFNHFFNGLFHIVIFLVEEICNEIDVVPVIGVV